MLRFESNVFVLLIHNENVPQHQMSQGKLFRFHVNRSKICVYLIFFKIGFKTNELKAGSIEFTETSIAALINYAQMVGKINKRQ